MLNEEVFRVLEPVFIQNISPHIRAAYDRSTPSVYFLFPPGWRGVCHCVEPPVRAGTAGDHTLWQDRAQLEGGIGWWRQIAEALDSVDFLILILTPAAVYSPVVKQEWRYARQREVCVYPVKGVTDTELDYRSLLKWMCKVHFFDLNRE
jgi:hypothetical protein